MSSLALLKDAKLSMATGIRDRELHAGDKQSVEVTELVIAMLNLPWVYFTQSFLLKLPLLYAFGLFSFVTDFSLPHNQITHHAWAV